MIRLLSLFGLLAVASGQNIFAAFPLYISVPGCPQTWRDVSLGGDSIGDPITNVPTQAQCQNLCNTQSTCTSWAHVNSSSTCTLRATYNGQVVTENPTRVVVSGVKSGCHPGIAPNDIGYAFYWLRGNELTVEVNANGFNTSVIAAHIHCDPVDGPRQCGAGQTCPACVDFVALSGSTNLPFKVTTIVSDAVRNQITKANGYVNIHTQFTPSGELRGELVALGAAPNWAADMASSQQVPPISTQTQGDAFYWLDASSGQTTARLYTTVPLFRFLSARIATAKRGVAGVLTPIGFPSAGQNNGVLTTTFTLNAIQFNNLYQYRLYQSVFTTTNPSGEIRGQIYPTTVPLILGTPSVDGLLWRNTRGLDSTTLTFGINFTTPNIGNEIWVTFPEGFSFDVDGKTDVLFVVGLAPPQSVVVVDQTVQLRFGTLSFLDNTDLFVRFTITNLGLPNNCEQKPFTIATRTCYNDKLFNLDDALVRKCQVLPSMDQSITAVLPNALPAGCSPYGCEACKFFYRSPTDGKRIFSCEHNGLTFFRADVPTTPCTPNVIQ